MKKRLNPWILLFFLGFILYPTLEILYRGYSHPSMALLGGICLVLIRLVDLWGGRLRPVWKALLSAVIITQLEFIFGVVLNLGLGLGVWDYSALPFQLAGQISLLFSFYWFLLARFAIFLFRRIPHLQIRPKGASKGS